MLASYTNKSLTSILTVYSVTINAPIMGIIVHCTSLLYAAAQWSQPTEMQVQRPLHPASACLLDTQQISIDKVNGSNTMSVSIVNTPQLQAQC